MDGKFRTCIVIIDAEPYPVHILNIPLESDVLPRSTVWCSVTDTEPQARTQLRKLNKRHAAITPEADSRRSVRST